MQDYETAQKLALTFVENPQTPKEIRSALIDAEAIATPTLKELRKSVSLVESIRKEVLAGETTEERLVDATARLGAWTVSLRAQITALQTTIADARAELKDTVWEPSLVPIEPEMPPDNVFLRRLELQEV
jgi:hypothetical protein